jgi:diadenosine tetraphosphatase ApaH/serine/threonine PP2A family protein phosphatase
VRGLQSSMTVGDFIASIESQTGIHRARVRLYISGRHLADESRTLLQAGVVRHAVVSLVRGPLMSPLADDALFSGGDRGVGKLNLKVLWHTFMEEGRLSLPAARRVVERATSLLMNLPNTLEVHEPCTVVTDLHGQWYDMKTVFDQGGHWDTTQYLFLGDYVDRGAFSLELVLFLFACKVNHPDRFHLLRGNHESVSTTKRMGFLEECQVKYDVAGGTDLYTDFMTAFAALPVAAVLHTGGKKVFCVHGGISASVQTVADIDAVNRFVEPTNEPVVRDLLWADPDDDLIAPKPIEFLYDLAALPERAGGSGKRYRGGTVTAKMFTPSERGGVVKKFTYDAICTFLENNGFVTMIRGHQQKPGFEFHSPGSQYDFPVCITLFSAPNYTDHSKNTGAIAVFQEGKMEIREYGWRLHPVYTPQFQRDFNREDFHQFVHMTDENALIALTEEQLDHAFLGLFPRRPPPGAKRDLWAILRANLGRIPELAGRVSKIDSLKRTKSMIAWFSTMDHLTKALAAESEYELYYEDEDSMDISNGSALDNLKDRIRKAYSGQGKGKGKGKGKGQGKGNVKTGPPGPPQKMDGLSSRIKAGFAQYEDYSDDDDEYEYEYEYSDES